MILILTLWFNTLTLWFANRASRRAELLLPFVAAVSLEHEHTSSPHMHAHNIYISMTNHSYPICCSGLALIIKDLALRVIRKMKISLLFNFYIRG